VLEDLFEIIGRHVPSNGQHVVVADKHKSMGLPLKMVVGVYVRKCSMLDFVSI
jgi:hypothetical protein